MGYCAAREEKLSTDAERADDDSVHSSRGASSSIREQELDAFT